MPYRCLTEFVEELGHSGELARVETEVDPALQLALQAAELGKSGGNVLLFGTVKGHDIPVLCNLFGDERRICRSLGVERIEDAAGRLGQLLDSASPAGWFERLKAGSQPTVLGSVAPRKVKSAACQQIVRLGGDIDLSDLPILQVLDEEAGRIAYSAAVFSAEPDSHLPIAERLDLQRIDQTRLAVCWTPCSEHARLLGEYRTRGRRMPMAVVLGGDPAFLLATAAPLPAGTDVCAVAGLLREKPLDVVPCRGVDLEVPAEAEIVLEGFIDPAAPTVMAGPICGPMGHCSQPMHAPVLQVTAVTHRANPIYAAMIPGPPPNESSTVARAMQTVFLPLARLAMPELVDYDLPAFGAARHWAAVSIRKSYPGQGRRAAHAAWNLPATRFAKMIVIVDGNVDVHDLDEVMAAVAANFRPGLDLVIDRGPTDPFDPSATPATLGERMALDATRKSVSE